MIKTPKFLNTGVLLLTAVVILGFSTDSLAKPSKDRKTRVVIKHPSPNYGRVVKRLPARHRRISVGKSDYYYNSGRFYRSRSNGYVIVRPPIGAIVASIPVGNVTFTIGTVPYYYYSGIHYRRVPTGYLVVEPPTQTVIVEETPNDYWEGFSSGEQVKVTAHLLNVRSGPGMRRSLVGQVRRGTRLVVRGHSPGWLYVSLPDGRHGWVMADYITALPQPSSG